MSSPARPPTDFAVLAAPSSRDRRPAPTGRVLKPAPWQSIREGTYTTGVSFQELITGQLLDADKAKPFFKKASKKFSGDKTVVFDKDRDFDKVEKPLEGMLSLWQLCELVSDSDVRLGGLCSQETAVPPADLQAESEDLQPENIGVKAELEAWEAEFRAGLHDLSLASLEATTPQSARVRGSHRKTSKQPEATTPRSARAWGWKQKTSKQPEATAPQSARARGSQRKTSKQPEGTSSNNSLATLPDIAPSVEEERPPCSELLAERGVRHEDLLARAEESFWVARANVALRARLGMNADIDEMRGNVAGPKPFHLRQVSGGGVQRTKAPRGALKTAR